MTSAPTPIEVARADESASLGGQRMGELPPVPGVEPEVETAFGQRNVVAPPSSEDVGEALEAAVVSGALLGDMGVVIQGGDGGRLSGSGHHHPDVLAHLPEVVDELGVAGVEAHSQAGQVRP